MAHEGTPGRMPPSDPRRSVARAYDMQFHGTSEYRGGNCPASKYYDRGRFGRLFPLLPALNADPVALMDLGAAGGPMDAKDPPPPAPGTNPEHPDGLGAGFTFLGQFLDHDITFDPTSSLGRQADPEAISNFRTPCFELDSVYGSGPGASPHLYERGDRSRLLVGAGGHDLPRNVEDTALLGDPRNDENLIISQLHLAVLRFHNAVADRVRGQVGGNSHVRQSVFETAQRLVRWHYQWIIVHEYLPAIVGKPMVDAVLANRRFFRWRNEPYIPVEFAVAAFRFGHTQVRPGYQINAGFGGAIFPQLGGGRPVDETRTVDWKLFFEIGGSSPQVSKAFDPLLSSPLHNLPFASGGPGDPKSLAQRNLLRGLTFGLPSGQDLAAAMMGPHQQDVDRQSPELSDKDRLRPIEPLLPEELDELRAFGLHEHTPLWYYILKEAELRGGSRTLGPVGGRIVAEVFIGLLQGDHHSYLCASPRWRPNLGTDGEFTVADLLKMAGVAGS